MTPILSVVIPVYKVEDYLERCVNSVLSQDFRDLEVVLVDDGSPDRCPEICDEFARRDERVRVIHKPNGGLSSARNAGIEVAKGEFIAFLDSDDQWAEGKLRPLMEDVMRDRPEMVLYLSYNLLPDGTLAERQYGDFFKNRWCYMNRMDYYRQVIESGDFHESACTKIFKASFITENELLFKKGITGEDTEWMFRVLRVVKKIAISSIPLFTCTIGRTGSITNSISIRNVKDLISTINGSLDYYKSNSEADTKQYELAQCAYLWSSCLAFVSALPAADTRDLKPQLKAIGKQLDLNAHPKSRKVAKIYNVLGFEVTAKVLELYLRLHKKNLINRKTKVNG